MTVRRLAALLSVAGLVAASAGSAAAATKSPLHHASVQPTKPAAAPIPAASAPAQECSREIADDAQAISGDDVAALETDATDLAGITMLRIRTVTGVPGGDLNAYEKQLQISCGWADAANVRQPRLLVLLVAPDDRQMGIYPGPALVGTITEQVWLTIEQENMGPYFKDAEWSTGLQAGVDSLDRVLKGGSLGIGPSEEPSAFPSATGPIQYDANGNLIQGDGSAEHPYVSDPNGVLGGSSGSQGSAAFGLVIAIFAGLALIGAITGVLGWSSRSRRGPYDSTADLWNSSGNHHGGHHGGGIGGGFGGGMDSGGGGSSSDGGGGSSGF
jgi:uncharacterized protein